MNNILLHKLNENTLIPYVTVKLELHSDPDSLESESLWCRLWSECGADIGRHHIQISAILRNAIGVILKF